MSHPEERQDRAFFTSLHGLFVPLTKAPKRLEVLGIRDAFLTLKNRKNSDSSRSFSSMVLVCAAVGGM